MYWLEAVFAHRGLGSAKWCQVLPYHCHPSVVPSLTHYPKYLHTYIPTSLYSTPIHSHLATGVSQVSYISLSVPLMHDTISHYKVVPRHHWYAWSLCAQLSLDCWHKFCYLATKLALAHSQYVQWPPNCGYGGGETIVLAYNPPRCSLSVGYSFVIFKSLFNSFSLTHTHTHTHTVLFSLCSSIIKVSEHMDVACDWLFRFMLGYLVYKLSKH